ncbi:MAG: hypothetical protein ABS99_04835 [Acetobacteraceae bacterium SCN 69-10]|nr:MAG: hypothetical protein ABS99_04835 [Acetobacteraceae bacterium SCN 69-10]
MTKTITRLYNIYDHATQTIVALRAAGFLDAEISLLGPANAATGLASDAPGAAGADAEIGAGVGGAVGAGTGLLTGLGLMAIRAAAGGITGGLTGAGISDSDANVYAEGVRRGGSLVTVRAPDDREAEARRILDDHMPMDVEAREAEYRSEGWAAFDPKARPYIHIVGATDPAMMERP